MAIRPAIDAVTTADHGPAFVFFDVEAVVTTTDRARALPVVGPHLFELQGFGPFPSGRQRLPLRVV